MMIGFSDGKPSQYQRIHELLLTHYSLQENEWNFIASAAHEQALVDSRRAIHHEKWKQYIKGVKAKMKGTLRASPASLPHLIPVLEGLFMLKREKSGKVVYKRKFRVFVSLIGNFYTMFGQDEIRIEDDQPGLDNQSVGFQPVLYPAPYGIYRPWFFLIKETMATEYPGYEFVPYDTLRYRLKDIATGYSGAEGAPQSLFQALFSPEDISSYLTVTDHEKMPFEEGEFD